MEGGRAALSNKRNLTPENGLTVGEEAYASMVRKISWSEFRASGFLWWINTLLHTFGLAIVFDFNEDDGTLGEVYPARVKFRGFDEQSNTNGYVKVSKYMNENSAILERESES